MTIVHTGKAPRRPMITALIPWTPCRQLLMDKVGMAPPFPCNSGHMITIPEHAMPHGTPNTKPRHSMITKTQRP